MFVLLRRCMRVRLGIGLQGDLLPEVLIVVVLFSFCCVDF
jgi:hypothetical protein